MRGSFDSVLLDTVVAVGTWPEDGPGDHCSMVRFNQPGGVCFVDYIALPTGLLSRDQQCF